MKKFNYILFIFIILFTQSCSTSKPKSTIKPVEQSNANNFHKRYDDKKINLVIYTAWQNFHNKRFEHAALDFERLIVKKYNHFDVLFGAGIAYMNYYDLNKAIKYFTIALQKKPDHFEALYFRAEVYRLLKNFSYAKKDLKKLISLKKIEPFICGLYKNDLTGQYNCNIRLTKAKEILKSL